MSNATSEDVRLKKFIGRDTLFWRPEQIAAFELMCALTRTKETVDEAWQWKRQQGIPFAAWRGISKSKRKRLLDGYLERGKQ